MKRIKDTIRLARKYFVDSLVVLFPFIVTFWILSLCFDFFKGFSSKLFFAFLSEKFFESTVFSWISSVLGFVFFFSFVMFLGWFGRQYLGKILFSLIEILLKRIPIIKGIYEISKNVISIVNNSNYKTHVSFLEFTAKNIYTFGIVTGELSSEEMCEYFKIEKNIIEVDKKCDCGFLTCFIPLSPNPTAGYFVMFAKNDEQKLNLSIEEAAKIVFTIGYYPESLK